MKIQRVHTDAGWHGRILGDNGETVWTTEVYTDPRKVSRAITFLWIDMPAGAQLEDVDERADADD